MPNTEKVGLWWVYESPVCVCVRATMNVHRRWSVFKWPACACITSHTIQTDARIQMYSSCLQLLLIFFITINNGLTKHVNQGWQKVILTTANFTVLHLNMHHIQPWECDGMTSLKSTIIPLKQLCSRILQAFTWLKFPIPVCSFLAIKMTNGY